MSSLRNLSTGRHGSSFRVLCVGDFSLLSDSFISAGQVHTGLQRSSKSSGIFKYILAHLGAQHDSGVSNDANAGQAVLDAFVQQVLPSPDVTFLYASPKLSKQKIILKMKQFLKRAGTDTLVVIYIGNADERGDWILGSQTITLQEVVAKWQRHQKQGQRLVLVVDAPHSCQWVLNLQRLPQQEQLNLSMCIQASGSMQSSCHEQGAFLKAYIKYHTTQQSIPAGIFPCYHSTWGSDSLTEFGSSLKFLSDHGKQQLPAVGPSEAASGAAAATPSARLCTAPVSSLCRPAGMADGSTASHHAANRGTAGTAGHDTSSPAKDVMPPAPTPEAAKDEPPEANNPPGQQRASSKSALDRNSDFHEELSYMLDKELKQQHCRARRQAVGGHQDLISMLLDEQPESQTDTESEWSGPLTLVPPARWNGHNGYSNTPGSPRESPKEAPCNTTQSSFANLQMSSLSRLELEEVADQAPDLPQQAFTLSRLSKRTSGLGNGGLSGMRPGDRSISISNTDFDATGTGDVSMRSSGNDWIVSHTDLSTARGSQTSRNLLRQVLTSNLSEMDEVPYRKPRRFEVAGDDGSPGLFSSDPKSFDELQEPGQGAGVLRGRGNDSMEAAESGLARIP